jgi:hypothetical protein
MQAQIKTINNVIELSYTDINEFLSLLDEHIKTHSTLLIKLRKDHDELKIMRLLSKYDYRFESMDRMYLLCF